MAIQDINATPPDAVTKATEATEVEKAYLECIDADNPKALTPECEVIRTSYESIRDAQKQLRDLLLKP